MPTLQPTVLKMLGDEKSGDGSDPGEENEDSGRSGGAGSGGGDEPDDDEDEPEKYSHQFHFTDDAGVPYSEARYIAFFEDGSQICGETDKDGYTEIFTTDSEQIIKIRLLHQSIDMIEGGVYE